MAAKKEKDRDIIGTGKKPNELWVDNGIISVVLK